MVIQGASAAADQAHSRATLTAIVPVPPPAPKPGDELVADAWQRAAVGPVTEVTAELPQPAAAQAAANADNSRDRYGVFTAGRVSSRGPATIGGCASAPDVSRSPRLSPFAEAR